jgi:hypothetical protein
MEFNSQESLQDLSLVERDVLRCFKRLRRENRSPHIADIRDILGCRHSAHIPGLVISLIKKGYIQDMVPSAVILQMPVRRRMTGRAAKHA